MVLRRLVKTIKEEEGYVGMQVMGLVGMGEEECGASMEEEEMTAISDLTYKL